MKRFFSAFIIASLLVCAMLLTACPAEEPPETSHVCEYTSKVVQPTCTERGYTLYTCEECEYTYRDEFVDPVPTKHKEFVVKETVPATCTEDGYIIEICPDCGVERTKANGVAGHVMSAWETVQAPTCTDYGVERRSCINCDECNEERDINPSHTYEVVEVIAATCTSNGYTVKECSVCGNSINDNYTNALEHKFPADPEWVVLEPATCEKEGIKANYCEHGCGEYQSAVIPKHFYEIIKEEATCTGYGKEYAKCTECGDTYLISQTSPLGHKYEVWTEIENTGIEQSECEHCGELAQRPKE